MVHSTWKVNRLQTWSNMTRNCHEEHFCDISNALPSSDVLFFIFYYQTNGSPVKLYALQVISVGQCKKVQCVSTGVTFSCTNPPISGQQLCWHIFYSMMILWSDIGNLVFDVSPNVMFVYIEFKIEYPLSPRFLLLEYRSPWSYFYIFLKSRT